MPVCRDSAIYPSLIQSHHVVIVITSVQSLIKSMIHDQTSQLVSIVAADSELNGELACVALAPVGFT